jgi:hypothetical protein
MSREPRTEAGKRLSGVASPVASSVGLMCRGLVSVPVPETP